MNYKEILYEHRGRAAWIYLNRPKAMNTITTVMALELENALTKAESDSNVRSLVLSGKGQAFCAGADLKVFLATMNETEKLGPDFLDHVTVAMNHLRQFTKPVIVALNGLALAGGLELVMCCDIVFAVESAKLGDVHSNFGVFPGAGGAAVLPRKIGLNRAKYLLFTGDMITAQEMMDSGIVNRVVAENDLESSVQALAEKLAKKSPLVLQKMKELANQSMDQSEQSSLRHELLALRDHLRSYDMQEGLVAFSEKREPNFKGE